MIEHLNHRPNELMHPSFKQVRIRQFPDIGVTLGLEEALRIEKMKRNCLASLFISKYAVKDECGLSALEVPWPFFAQGYISAYGDAL
jgi:hypothetical protein